MEKEKLHVKLNGVSVVTIIQILIFLAAFGCFVYACTWDAGYEHLRGTFFTYFGVLFISGLTLIPVKKLVKAAEYYIARIEKDYEIVEPEVEVGAKK